MNSEVLDDVDLKDFDFEKAFSDSDDDQGNNTSFSVEENKVRRFYDEGSVPWVRAVYNVFARYADSNSRNYRDIIANELKREGVFVSNNLDEEFLRIKKQVSEFFDIEISNRYIAFRWKNTDHPNQEVIEKRPDKTEVAKNMIFVFALLISLSAVFFIVFLVKKSDAQTPVADFKEVSVTNVEHHDDQSAVLPSMSLADSINALIDSESFSLAIEKIRDSREVLDDEFVSHAKRRINILVAAKSNSLRSFIEELSKEGKYYEAFELEQLYDKDVFQLAGNGLSKKLRQDLITKWVLSHKNSLSKNEAMSIVTKQARIILKSESHQVVEKAGKFYLEYGLKKHST